MKGKFPFRFAAKQSILPSKAVLYPCEHSYNIILISAGRTNLSQTLQIPNDHENIHSASLCAMHWGVDDHAFPSFSILTCLNEFISICYTSPFFDVVQMRHYFWFARFWFALFWFAPFWFAWFCLVAPLMALWVGAVAISGRAVPFAVGVADG